MVLVFLRNTFEMSEKFIDYFRLGQEILVGETVIEFAKGRLNLTGELLAHMPAVSEIVIFFALLEAFTENEEKIDVVLNSDIFGNMTEEIVFDNDAAERVDEIFQLLESGSLGFIGVRLANIIYGVIFNLANALAGDAIGLADGIEGHLLGGFAEAVSRNENSSGSVRKNSKKSAD